MQTRENNSNRQRKRQQLDWELTVKAHVAIRLLWFYDSDFSLSVIFSSLPQTCSLRPCFTEPSDNSDLSIETYIQQSQTKSEDQDTRGKGFDPKRNFSWGQITLPGPRIFSSDIVFSLQVTDFPSQIFALLPRGVMFVSLGFGYRCLPPAFSHHFFLLKLPHLQVSAWWYGLRSGAGLHQLPPPRTSHHPTPLPAHLLQRLSISQNCRMTHGQLEDICYLQMFKLTLLLSQSLQGKPSLTTNYSFWEGGEVREINGSWGLGAEEVFSFGCSIWRLRPKSWRGDLGAESSLSLLGRRTGSSGLPLYLASESQGCINHLYRHFDSGRGGEEFVP